MFSVANIVNVSAMAVRILTVITFIFIAVYQVIKVVY